MPSVKSFAVLQKKKLRNKLYLNSEVWGCGEEKGFGSVKKRLLEMFKENVNLKSLEH